MERHGLDRLKRPQRSSAIRRVWVPIFAGILVLYVVFVVKVQYYASTANAKANAIGDGTHGYDGAAAAVLKNQQAQAATVIPERTAAVHDEAQDPVTFHMSRRPKGQKATVEPAIQVGAINKQPKTAAATAPTAETKTTQQPLHQPKPEVAAITSTEQAARPTAAGVANDPPQATTTQPPATPAPTPTPVTTTRMPRTVVATEETDLPVNLAPEHVTETVTMTVTPLPAPAPVQTKDPLAASRHHRVFGFNEMNDYLVAYRAATPDESLFLYFTCSDSKFQPYDWSDLCTDASKKVYDVFAKSPANNKLLTIYAGSESFWKYKNAFRDDADLRVKTVPSIMKWHANGKGETSGMMVAETLTEEPFLRYLFKNIDLPDHFLTPAAMADTKIVTTVKSYDAYQQQLATYKQEQKPRRPLYLVFISGRIKSNNRPWCPYCRFSELPLEYGFKAFAPPNARLLRIEVTDSYSEWKKPNAYTTDQALGPLRGVPGFFSVRQLANEQLQMDRVYERFDRLATLKNLFSTVALVKDE